MSDPFTESCSVCHRLAYFSPLTDGICSHCTPNPDRDLVIRMSETMDEPCLAYSPDEYRRAVRYLWLTLNPELRPKKR